MGDLPTGGSDVLDEVYGTGNEVKDTVDEIHQYSSESSSSGDWDPLSKLINKGLSFVIDYISPVKEALNLVTGDSDALNSAAGNYNKISDEINQLGQELHDELKSGFTNWQGDASDAAHKECAQLLDGIHGTAQLSAYISEVLQASAVLMKAAHDIIISIISDFVEQMLITWAIGLAGSIITLGASDAAATAATVTEAGIAIGKAGKEVSTVGKLVAKVAKVIGKIIKVIEKIAKMLEKIAGKIAKLGGKIGKIAEKVAGKGGKLGELAGKGIGKVGDKVGKAGEEVGKYGKGLDDLAKAAKEGDKAGVKDGLEKGLQKAGELKDKFDNAHDKFDEYKKKVEDWTGTGGDDQNSDQNSGHMKIPEKKGYGDILKDHAKEAGKDIWNNEKEIAKEGYEAGAYPHQSNQQISSELGATNTGGSYATDADKQELGRQYDDIRNQPLT